MCGLITKNKTKQQYSEVAVTKPTHKHKLHFLHINDQKRTISKVIEHDVKKHQVLNFTKYVIYL